MSDAEQYEYRKIKDKRQVRDIEDKYRRSPSDSKPLFFNNVIKYIKSGPIVGQYRKISEPLAGVINSFIPLQLGQKKRLIETNPNKMVDLLQVEQARLVDKLGPLVTFSSEGDNHGYKPNPKLNDYQKESIKKWLKSMRLLVAED